MQVLPFVLLNPFIADMLGFIKIFLLKSAHKYYIYMGSPLHFVLLLVFTVVNSFVIYDSVR